MKKILYILLFIFTTGFLIFTFIGFQRATNSNSITAEQSQLDQSESIQQSGTDNEGNSTDTIRSLDSSEMRHLPFAESNEVDNTAPDESNDRIGTHMTLTPSAEMAPPVISGRDAAPFSPLSAPSSH